MPAIQTDTWDIEMSHVRMQTKRYTALIRARRVQRKLNDGSWVDWAHRQQLTDIDLKATTRPRLRDRAEELNETAERWARGEEMEQALREKRQEDRARRRVEARRRFARWCDHRFEHLGDAYRESSLRTYCKGAPDYQKGERSFVEWLSIWLPEHRPEQHDEFMSKWQRIRRDCDLPEGTHYL